jgi:hypothetical protein
MDEYNHKKILCTSKFLENKCKYDKKCIYAHSLYEQNLEFDRKKAYEIILDDKLKNQCKLFNLSDDFYRDFIFYTNYCENCKISKCLGGLNCRYGVCNYYFKICKNDLLSGDCINNTKNILIPDNLNKSLKYERSESYISCVNGHHLTTRGLPCYKSFIMSKQPIINTSTFVNNFFNKKEILSLDEYDDIMNEINIIKNNDDKSEDQIDLI